MSLAPYEQRALAGIEATLRSSDPRLAALLATLTVPASRGRIPRLGRLSPRWPRTRPFIPVTTAMAMITLIVLALLLSHPASRPCTYRSGPVTPAGQLSSCQRPGSTTPSPEPSRRRRWRRAPALWRPNEARGIRPWPKVIAAGK